MLDIKITPTFIETAFKHLKDDGIFLLHTIGNNDDTSFGDPWMNKYIFPNGMLPSISQIGKATEAYFVMEDWHNFGAYYDKTLMAWHHNFNKHWPELENQYDNLLSDVELLSFILRRAFACATNSIMANSPV